TGVGESIKSCQLLTGQTDEVVTCVDWRDPACQGVNRFFVHELQRIYDGEQFREEHQLRDKFGEEMSRAVFVKNGGVGHALYLTGDIFKPHFSVCRKTCLLYSALTKATCPNYGNAIALFKKIMFTEPTEELKGRMIIPY
ncbi:MAG: hypothetical protein KAH18_11225, partial [Psychromonas sp.]|nr:hypothetical protein [Psychromonas sp.]